MLFSPSVKWHKRDQPPEGTDRAQGKALFLPLRRALTGLDRDPDMAALLPLIGEVRAVTRLRG